MVGIAGLGGLGSVVAWALARSGVGRLIVADFDRVEGDNLNRQQYFVEQIGQSKVTATIENLQRVNPEVQVTGHEVQLDEANIPTIFADVDVVAECFDQASAKQMMVETVLTKLPGTPIVTVSGLAGYGHSNAIRTRVVTDRLILVGDNERGIDQGLPLTAGRVWIAASHQANAILELLLDGRIASETP